MTGYQPTTTDQEQNAGRSRHGIPMQQSFWKRVSGHRPLMNRKPGGFRRRLVLRQKFLMHSGLAILVRTIVNRRSDFEIPMPGRRRQRPLQSGRIPRVPGSFRPFEHAVEEVHEKYEGRQSQTKGAQTDENLQRLLTLHEVIQVRISDSARHPVQPQVMHGEEGQVEKHERQNEMHLTPEFVHHVSEHLRVPEVDSTEYPEQTAAE